MFAPRALSAPTVTFCLAALAAASTGGCDQKTPEPAPPRPDAAAPPAASAAPAPLSARVTRPAAERLVAIGDLHGDLEAARRALRLAGAIDDRDRWVGGKLVVVQTGDLIDRGDADREVLALVDRLVAEAKAAGGEFISLLGNHELMNVALDFRYVTPKSFAAFDDAGHGHGEGGLRAAASAAPQATASSPARPDGGARGAGPTDVKRGRTTAFAPGGPYALRFAERNIFVKVGDTVFAHGGVLPKHVDYGMDRMNDEVRAWLLGQRPEPPAVVTGDDGPVWTRAYSLPDRAPACAQLAEALARLGAKRMVVGHTVQQGGINGTCGERVWRIDVGLSRFYGGPTQALEIGPGGAKVLREGG